jgi:hypothetical protein
MNNLQFEWNAGPFGPRSGRAKVLEYTLKQAVTLKNFVRLFSLTQAAGSRIEMRGNSGGAGSVRAYAHGFRFAAAVEV